MADTTTEQVRRAISGVDAEGLTIANYEIAVSVTDKGDLPDDRLLVVTIIDPEDAKGDTFARVATIADFNDVTVDRPTAIANDEDVYRTSVFVFTYDNLETANNAQDVLKSRIDELVTDYLLFQTEFVASPTAESTIHPQVTSDTFNSLVSAYSSSATAEATALVTRDAAKTAYDESVVDAAEAALAVTAAQAALDDCNQAKGWFDALYNAMAAPAFATQAETFRLAAETFRTGINITGVDPVSEATLVTAHNLFANQQTIANAALATALSNQTSFAAQCAAKESALTTANTAKATADTAVATKRTAYDDAQTAYENAQQATEASLAAITALKPDFDPETDIT
jgi:hypothetical protein